MGEFEENGYVIVPNAVHRSLCDEVVNAYQREVKPYQAPLLRFSSEREESPNEFDNFGHVKNAVSWRSARSLLFPKFSDAVAESQLELGRIVNGLCGDSRYLTAALFEVSSGFGPHQDARFSNVEADGRAGWLALEDIDLNAGPLFMCPNSRSWVAWNSDPAVYLSDLAQAVKEGLFTKVPMLLKKGDVVIFDSMTVHGAEPVIDPSLSRYALSLHYGR